MTFQEDRSIEITGRIIIKSLVQKTNWSKPISAVVSAWTENFLRPTLTSFHINRVGLQVFFSTIRTKAARRRNRSTHNTALCIHKSERAGLFSTVHMHLTNQINLIQNRSIYLSDKYNTYVMEYFFRMQHLSREIIIDPFLPISLYLLVLPLKLLWKI